MDAFLTTASPLTLDGASGLISSFRAHHPGVPAYVLATDDLDPTRVTGEVLFVSDVCKSTPFALVGTLDDTNQVVFALPFALERLLGKHGAVVYAAPGCLVVRPMDELVGTLEGSSVALVSQSHALQTDSSTSELNRASEIAPSISSRILGLRKGAIPLLADWQQIMEQTFYDVVQRHPADAIRGWVASLVGTKGVAIAGETTLLSWTDYAAIAANRATGPAASILLADELWALGREHAVAKEAGEEIEVNWQMLFDKVHDSRPLTGLMQIVEDAVAAHHDSAKESFYFGHLAKEIRRSADPTGARWKQDEDFLDWLFEENNYGLTRVAHLYWASNGYLQKEFPEVPYDPMRFRAWNDRRAIVELGRDLWDRHGVTVKPEDAGDAALEPRSLSTAIAWRRNTMATLIPGHLARMKRREDRRDPAHRRGVAPPVRVPVARVSQSYGRSPRQLSILGCFRAESGLGQAARASLEAVRLLGREFSYIDTSEEYPSRNEVDPKLERETFGAFGEVNLLHANADELITLSGRVFRNRLAGRFNAAMWFWEAADLPMRSRPAFEVVDELWLASEYLADVFGQYAKVPVKVVGLAADLPESRAADRAALGWQDDQFVFLFVYDALSAYGRKNPEKTLDAFIQAFAPDFDNVRFVLKVSNLNKFPAAEARLQAKALKYPAITLIDSYYPRDRVLDMMAAADVYVSLHAAEGFGLTLLEAMALGTPVICTGYSGNMDFTNADNSWLVDYQMIATDEQTGPYPKGSVWAQPNVDTASDLMRYAAANPAMTVEKGKRAAIDAANAASLERYAARLDEQLRRVL